MSSPVLGLIVAASTLVSQHNHRDLPLAWCGVGSPAAPWVGRALFERLDPAHQEIFASIALNRAEGKPTPIMCLDPDADDETVAAFAAFFDNQLADRFNLNTRWGATANNPAGPTDQGFAPTVITWSVVPDGTDLNNGVETPQPSNLRAFLDGIYGSEATWLPIFESVFERWEALTGVDYVYTTFDDESPILSNQGQLGVRADVRIGGRFIDGPGNVLAFNYFPNFGDMVIDTGDTFYNTTVNNSIRLRNVLSHEHGHGAGHFHVCPVNATKLMEPTVAVPYDGPRADDIRGMHRQYGDVNEPDDSLATARNIGNIAPGQDFTLGPTPAPIVPFASVLSIDADGEQDFHAFSITASTQLTVTLIPVGTTYDNAQQAGCSSGVAGCCSRNFTNTRALMDLGLELLNNAGTILASSTAAPAAQNETVTLSLTPGNYRLRVFETGELDETQFYHLQFSTSGGNVVRVIPESIPDAPIPGNQTSSVIFVVDNGNDTLVQAPRIQVRRVSSQTFSSAAMTSLGNNRWRGDITPDACEPHLFYISAQGAATGEVLFPPAGPLAPIPLEVGTPSNAVNFSFGPAGDQGWTVTNSPQLTDGAWERAQPTLAYCGIGDPDSDFDGSGWCFVTDDDQPTSGTICNNDVDAGETTLTSPSINLSTLSRPALEYARWFNNGITSSTPNDPFIVEVSFNNGTTWVNLEQVGPIDSSNPPQTQGDWIVRRFDLTPIVGNTTAFRVRFRVSDANPGARVEAAVDAVRIITFDCNAAPTPCPGDADGNNTVNFTDITTILSNFGTVYAPATGPGDSDSNGTVNFTDITSTLASFGSSCP